MHSRSHVHAQTQRQRQSSTHVCRVSKVTETWEGERKKRGKYVLFSFLMNLFMGGCFDGVWVSPRMGWCVFDGKELLSGDLHFLLSVEEKCGKVKGKGDKDRERKGKRSRGRRRWRWRWRQGQKKQAAKERKAWRGGEVKRTEEMEGGGDMWKREGKRG